MAKTIIITPDVGINIDNIPTEVFEYNPCIHNPTNGSTQFEVDDQNVDAIWAIVSRAARTAVRREAVGTSIVRITSSAGPTQADEQATAAPDQQCIEEEDTYIGDDDDENTAAPECDPVRPTMDHVGDHFSTSCDGALMPTGSVDSWPQIIAATLESEITSRAHNLNMKIQEFTRAWTNCISLKREIDELTCCVRNHPVIHRLISHVEELKNQDNLVDDIFFTNTKVVIITKHINTDNIPDLGSKSVGRMQFEINLKCLVGNPTGDDNPVKIRNLTREYVEDGIYWQCGHARRDAVCWGTSWSPLFNAFVAGDLHMVVDALIRFVKQPDPTDSWGEHIHNWPEAE